MKPLPKIRRLVRPPQFDVWRDGVTQSMLNTFQTCERRADLYLKRGLFRESSQESFAFGSAWHDVQNVCFSLAREGHPLATAQELVSFYDAHTSKPITDVAVHERRELLLAKLQAVTEGYLDQWSLDFTDRDWVALEHTFEFKLFLPRFGKPVTMRGKIDGLSRIRSDGSLQLKESKTRSQVNEDSITDKLPIDLQINLYAQAVRLEFQEFPKSVLYDVVRNPMFRLGAKETLHGYMQRVRDDVEKRRDHYFFRYVSALFEPDHRMWFREQLTPLVERFVTWAESGEPSLQNTSSCSFAGITCPYLPLCGRNDNTGLVRRDGPSPELADDPIVEQFLAWRSANS